MLGVVALLAAPALAHQTCWHPSMYGFKPEDKESSIQSSPLDLTWPKDQWWFHGYKNEPPEDGVFMELPAGGVFTCQLGGGKGYTDWGKKEYRDASMATDTRVGGNLHASSEADLMGSAIAIVYNSDPNGFEPNDMVVISVNHTSPWYKFTGYQIPADLPPCPPGGCHCSWNWQHKDDTGGQEMYHNMYRCNVTGGNPNSPPLAKPVIPRKCPFDQNNCTQGAKTPAWWTATPEGGGNIFQDAIDPPVYNLQYGFADGAQNDVWYHDEGGHWDPNAPLAPGPRNKDVTATMVTLPFTIAPAPTGPGAANGKAPAPKVTPDAQAKPETGNGTTSSSTGSVSDKAPSPTDKANALNVEGGGDDWYNPTSGDKGKGPEASANGTDTGATTNNGGKPTGTAGSGGKKKCKRGRSRRAVRV